MNATYTLRYEYPELEAVAAGATELHGVAKTIGMLVGAPLLGLLFVVAFPILGAAFIAWTAAKALVRHAAAVKRVALFAAAPIVGLAYAIAFPFIGVAALVYYGFAAAPR